MRARRLATCLLTLLAAGCPAREVAEIPIEQSREVVKRIPAYINRDLDLLFVIDNSGSMDDEQVSLANHFGDFIGVLQAIEGGLPNVHVGVVSSDAGGGALAYPVCTAIGDDGLLQSTARITGCTPPSGRYIIDEQIPGCEGDPSTCRNTNYSGSLADTFACIASLGIEGCGFEQHLESMKLALDGHNPANGGFLRPDAWLAVVLIADEDDCSASNTQIFDASTAMDAMDSALGPRGSFRCTEFGVTCGGEPVTREFATYGVCEPREDSPFLRHPRVYAQFLRDLKKQDPNLVMVGGIFGDPTPFEVGDDLSLGPADGKPDLMPSCTSAMGKAVPGVRLENFIAEFGANGIWTSICKDDLSSALMLVAEQLAKRIGTPCIEGQLDASDRDPGSPGLQIDCAVADERDGVETLIPRCVMASDTEPDVTASPAPCWYVYADPVRCDSAVYPTQLVLAIHRTVDALSGTDTVARCTTL